MSDQRGCRVTRRRGRTTAAALLLLLACAALYWPLSGAGFIGLDDASYVTENVHVRQGLQRDSVAWALTTFAVGNWHPLSWLSHMLDVELFGLRPGAHHLVSVALHGASSVVLLVALRVMTGSLGASFLVAALFSLHPLHVESVAWVAERKDVLSGLFFMLTLGAHAWHARRPSAARRLFVLLSFALGLLAKPMLVTLPFVLLLLDYWPLGRIGGAPFPRGGGAAAGTAGIGRCVAEKTALFLLAAGSSIVTVLAQRRSSAILELRDFPLPERLVNAAHSYGAYLLGTAWPLRLGMYYPLPEGGIDPAPAALSFLALLLLSIAAILHPRRRPHLAVGWFWFLGMLVPVIGIVQVGRQALADRYTYLPLVGIFLAGVWSARELASTGRARGRALRIAAAVALGSLLLVSGRQVRYWMNAETLFRRTLAVTERNHFIHGNLGVYLARQGRYGEAVESYRKALEIDPAYAAAHHNLAVALEELGDVEGAVRHYETGLALEPNHPKSASAHASLGRHLAARNEDATAQSHFQQALERDPDNVEVAFGLGAVYVGRGMLPQAEALFRGILAREPGHDRALVNLAVVLLLQGKEPEAAASYRRVLERDPGFARDGGRAATFLRERLGRR